MSDTLQTVLGYVLGALLFVGVIAFVVWRGTRRDRAWTAAADSIGLLYTRRDNTPLDVFAGFTILDARGARSLANVVSGTHSHARVWLADYRYTNTLPSSVEKYGFTLCMWQSDRLGLPHFRLHSRSRPRSMTNAPFVSRPEDDPEVPIEGGDEFARAFALQTSAPDEVRRWLGPGIQQRIMSIWKPYLEIEALGDRLIVTRRSWVDPTRLGQYLDEAAGILDDLARAGWR